MRDVKVGDVLVRGRNTPRVVRSVSRFKNGDLLCVHFAIRHCSWTHRCTTAVNYTDLRCLGYEPLGVNVPLNTALDKRIARDLLYENRFKPKLDCCDVRGAP
jgi:hypothetical protein